MAFVAFETVRDLGKSNCRHSIVPALFGLTLNLNLNLTLTLTLTLTLMGADFTYRREPDGNFCPYSWL